MRLNKYKINKYSTCIYNFFLILIISIFNVFIFLFPNEILNASKNGIILWANNILPTLLPFLISTNILIQAGMTQVLGLFLEPIMQPIFRVPGVSAFALISGMVCGYPIGAKVTQSLYKNNQISRSQAQRLISFCNNSGPLFILGFVGVSMLGDKKIGYFLMLVHYLSAIINGLIFRFFFGSDITNIKNIKKNIFHESKDHKQKIFFHVQSNKNIGIIISDSINNSVQIILHIGGFIVLFSIINKILEISNIISLLWVLFSRFSIFNELGYKNFYAIIAGLIELTNGTKILIQNNSCDLNKIIIILSALISFGGLSVHMQSLGFITKTDINPFVYLLSKISHAIISVFLTKTLLLFFSFRSKNIKGTYDFKTSFHDQLLFSFKNLILVIIIIMGLIFITQILKHLCRKN